MDIPFEQLPLSEKLSVVITFGEYICTIPFCDNRINLYSIGGVMIEVYIEALKTGNGVVTKVRAMTCYNDYDKYIQHIEILDLMWRD